MAVHDGKLFVGYPNVWSFDGRQWEFAGTPIGNTPLDQKPFLQVHSLSVFRGKLLAGMWPEARVVEHQGGERWTDRGRLGDGTEINALTVYNGKLYAGAIPRYDVSELTQPADRCIGSRFLTTSTVVTLAPQTRFLPSPSWPSHGS